jgi:hypothetical protein
MKALEFTRPGDQGHARFRSWLTAGAVGEPDPQVAAHAISCESCRNAIAAMDALQAINTARPDLPIVAPHPSPAPTRWAWARHVFPAAAVLVLAAAQVAGSGTVLAPGAVSGDSPPSIWHAVFGGAGDTPSTSASPSASAADGSDNPLAPGSGEPQAVPGGQVVPPWLFVPGATPVPLTPSSAPGSSPLPGSQPPGASSSPSSTSPPPPTATPPPPTPPPPTPPPPTPEPTPLPPPPTPEPTANQAPECSDGIDNDGDGLIDFGPFVPPLGNNDPGCLGPDDNSEELL